MGAVGAVDVCRFFLSILPSLLWWLNFSYPLKEKYTGCLICCGKFLWQRRHPCWEFWNNWRETEECFWKERKEAEQLAHNIISLPKQINTRKQRREHLLVPPISYLSTHKHLTWIVYFTFVLSLSSLSLSLFRHAPRPTTLHKHATSTSSPRMDLHYVVSFKITSVVVFFSPPKIPFLIVSCISSSSCLHAQHFGMVLRTW